ncbi:hypothetical protein LPJ59_001044 [Coemansia sp. RSA 2399]|nr:hypothetical protein LPJ59_001044 [Coemansia sp. RSA 2399]KAJ1907210.1 hypothetical protein LPJ81_000906 [Coemansia sp. IMI 209127]
MKAVSNLRIRMKQLGETSPPGEAANVDQDDKGSSLGFRRRARTSSGPAHLTTAAAAAAVAVVGQTTPRRSWAVLPRKLRGLHPAPVIIYVRENAQAVGRVMDALYDSLVGTYSVDSKDIRVTNVPTAFDLPSAVRRIGKSKQVVIVVGTLSRDKPWHDESQLSAVRKFLLHWSQSTPLPLIDGLFVADTQQELLHRVGDSAWDVCAGDDFGMADDQDEEAANGEKKKKEDEEEEEAEDGCLFGQYLAHRAIEMFYFEQRGW